MKRKVVPGEYSNGTERFRIEDTEKQEVISIHAITNVSYFPLEKGTTVPMNRGTIESIINDEDLNFRKE